MKIYISSLYACLPGVVLDESHQPVGSWITHPLVMRCDYITEALYGHQPVFDHLGKRRDAYGPTGVVSLVAGEDIEVGQPVMVDKDGVAYSVDRFF